jgi:ribosome recycling factor
MSDEYLSAMRDDFKKVTDDFKRDLATIRTGRATPQLLDAVQVQVQSYGATMPLNQLASISAPDARLLVVNPWDKGTLADIEKAIQSSGLGFNPMSDGQIIRVPIPALTGERRQEMVKSVKKLLEDHRVAARHVRREYNELFKDLKNSRDITEDELKTNLELVQKATDDSIAALEKIGAEKEKEVLEV